MNRLASGVDISKASFVGAVWVEGQAVELGEFANHPEGFVRLQQALQAQQQQQGASQIHLVVEPTGGYELGLVAFAYEQEWAVSLPNPRQVREWAKGMGKRAKTDRVDAKLLAQFAAQRQPPAQPPLAAAPRFSRVCQGLNGMKIRIPVGLTGEERPGPGQEFTGGGDDDELFGFTAADQTFVEGVQRIMAMHGTERPHVEQTAEGGVAHFRDGRTFAHAAPTLIRLRVEADQSGEAFGRALTGGERLPAVQLDQERQDDFGSDARQGQEALGIIVQLRMLAQVLGNRSFNLVQGLLQGLNHPLQISGHRRRNPRALGAPAAQRFETILFLLHHLLQVLAALQQTIQFTHLNGQWVLGGRLLGSPKTGQQQRILTVCLRTLATAFGPLAHLARIGQANRPPCFMGKGNQRQFIATSRFDDPLHRRRTATLLLGLHLGCQRRKASRFVGELAQGSTLALPQGNRLQVRFGHVDANPQRRHDASWVNYAPTASKGLPNVRPEDPALPGIRVYFPLILYALSGGLTVLGTGLAAFWAFYPGLFAIERTSVHLPYPIGLGLAREPLSGRRVCHSAGTTGSSLATSTIPAGTRGRRPSGRER
jgi:hypothetical protein